MSSKKSQFLAQYGDSNHIDKVIKSGGHSDEFFAATQNHGISKEHVAHLLNDETNSVAHLGLSKNNSLSTDQVDKLAENPYRAIRNNALEHKNVSASVFEKGLKNPEVDPSVHARMVATSPHMTKELLHHVISSDFAYNSDATEAAQSRLDKGDHK